jgi:hypothetical protein
MFAAVAGLRCVKFAIEGKLVLIYRSFSEPKRRQCMSFDASNQIAYLDIVVQYITILRPYSQADVAQNISAMSGRVPALFHFARSSIRILVQHL